MSENKEETLYISKIYYKKGKNATQVAKKIYDGYDQYVWYKAGLSVWKF